MNKRLIMYEWPHLIAFNSFMMEVPIMRKPIHCKSIDWFLYDTGLRHQRVKQENKMNFVLEAYLEPCQISMMKIFANIVNGF